MDRRATRRRGIVGTFGNTRVMVSVIFRAPCSRRVWLTSEKRNAISSEKSRAKRSPASAASYLIPLPHRRPQALRRSDRAIPLRLRAGDRAIGFQSIQYFRCCFGWYRSNRFSSARASFCSSLRAFIAQSSERKTAHKRRVNSVTGDPSARDSTTSNPAGICRNVADGGSKRRRPRRNESPLFYGLIASTVGRIRPLGDQIALVLWSAVTPINQIPRS